jgi:hypothetical protein
MQHLFSIPNKPLNSEIFTKANGWELWISGDDLVISGDCTKAEAQDALDAHNPPAPVEPTIADKLASVGLSIEELKAALGGN